jgi:hypothetical protein
MTSPVEANTNQQEHQTNRPQTSRARIELFCTRLFTQAPSQKNTVQEQDTFEANSAALITPPTTPKRQLNRSPSLGKLKVIQ